MSISVTVKPTSIVPTSRIYIISIWNVLPSILCLFLYLKIMISQFIISVVHIKVYIIMHAVDASMYGAYSTEQVWPFHQCRSPGQVISYTIIHIIMYKHTCIL